MSPTLAAIIVAATLFVLWAFAYATGAGAGVMCTSTRVGNTVYTYCTGN